MGFVRIFWKNNVQEAYLPKINISGQIVSEILAQLCSDNSIQTLLNLFGSSQVNWTLFFQNILTNPGSFPVHFGDHLQSEIICAGIIYDAVQISFH